MKVFKHKKCFFTLLEIVISVSLISILLTSLLYFYFEVNILNIKTDDIEKKAFQLRYLENRLYQIIPRILSKKDKNSIFFSGSSCDQFNKSGNPHLLFSFDNPINLISSDFSNHVIGRLFLDKENRLWLIIIPNLDKIEFKDQIPISKEILLEQVSSLDFSFFVWNQEENQKEPSFLLKGEWVSYWKQEYEDLPALIKIQINYIENNQEKNRIMIFPLPNANYKIIYEM